MARKIAIIGLGPTGSFAARAAFDMGCEVEIYATGDGSTPPGAFWLHWVPEGVAQDQKLHQIYVTGKGTAQKYSTRQWGKVYPSSFPLKPVWEKGFDPSEVLKKLVPSKCNINFMPFPLSDTDIKDLGGEFELVFQTFPSSESKKMQPALIPYIAAARLGTEDKSQHVVVYNGTDQGIVVREARLFGNHFLEFPKGMSEEEVRGHHDLSGYRVITLKDLHPDTKPWMSPKDSKIKFIGRWAQWDRKVLAHDAYAIVQNYIKELQNGN